MDPVNSKNERANDITPVGEPRSDLHVRFGLYEVNLRTHEFSKGGLKLRIPRQSFQILAMLLEKPGQVISREDLRRALWPDDVFVNFEGSLNSAVQKLRSALQDTSREPRYIETLPRIGYRFIASVELISSIPEAPQAAAPIAATLNSIELPSADKESSGEALDQLPASVPVSGSDWRRWAAATLLLVVVLAASYGGFRYRHKNPHMQPAEALPSPVIPSSLTRRSIAIMGFANVSGNAHNVWLSTAFTEMLATELAAGDQLRTVAGEHVARAKLELSLPNEDSYAGDTLARIHKDLGCDYVVTGSYLAVGQAGNGRLRLDARIQDAVTGDTVANVAVAGSQSDLFDLASRAGQQLRAKLGVEALTANQSEEVKLALPSDPEAARLYSDGLSKLRFYDDVAAGSLFEKVIQLQPEYAPAYSALASAWSALGYDAKAAVAARKAMDLSRNLPEQARLQTEARYYKINGEWTKAVEIYSRLRQSYPDNLDYALAIALAQSAMGKSAEAAATISGIRKLPFLDRDDPRIDLTDAGISGELGDYKREQTLAESAARKSEAAGQRLLLSRAEMIEGYAASSLGEFSRARDAYSAAQRLCAEAGDDVGAALAIMDSGLTLANQGDFSGARRNIEQALPVFQKKGDQASQAAALTNLGEIYGSEGNLPKQEHLLRQTLVISTKLNRTGKHDIELCDLSQVLLREGKFREAKDTLEPLVPHLRDAKETSLLGSALATLGAIAETQGDMATALRLDQESAVLFKGTNAKADYAAAQRSLGEAFAKAGDFVTANRVLAEALSLDREIGAKAEADLDQVALARISLAQEQPVDMGTLRPAIEELRQRKMNDDEIEAEIVLAREIIQHGQTADAARILEQTALLSAKSHDPTVRFDVALASAHLRTAQHRFNDAVRASRSTLLSAAAMGCVRCQLEARLELGQIELRSGNSEQGQAQLHKLADEASSRGFRLIADRANASSQ